MEIKNHVVDGRVFISTPQSASTSAWIMAGLNGAIDEKKITMYIFPEIYQKTRFI